MTDPRLEDHVVGLELELVELVEQQHRAADQYRPDEAVRLEKTISEVQLELAESAEAAVIAVSEQPPPPDSQAQVLAPTVDEVLGDRPSPFARS